MLASIKELIVSKICGLATFPHEVNKKALLTVLSLGKFCNGKIPFLLPEEQSRQILGSHVPVSQIKKDSVLLEICDDVDVRSKKHAIFFIDKHFFIRNSLCCDLHHYKVENSNRHVLVEYSSPNIAKPFHIGHLRSTIIGDFVANCAEKYFGKATRLNYLGDWGTQIGYIKAGLEDLEISERELSQDPIRILYKAYVKANNEPGIHEKAKRIFSELEYDSCTQEEKDFWAKVRLFTMDNLKETYKDLGIIFDEFCYESDYRISKIEELLNDLERVGIAKKRADGLLVLCHAHDSEVPLLKGDGTSLYLSRDIAAAVDRLTKYKNCSNIFYVADKSQAEHFEKVAKAVISFTGKDVIRHVQFGRVTGVSSRKGTTLLLQDILSKAIEKMASQQQASKNTRINDPEVTRILAVTLLKVYILRQARCRNFVFDWDLAMQGKGDTGLRLQYTHSRLCSLEEKCGVEVPLSCEPELINEPILIEIIMEIARTEEVMQLSIEQMESSYLVKHLFKLCNMLSRSLKEIKVKGEPTDVAQQRLLVYHTAKLTLNRCMSLLGLKPLKSI